MIYPKWPQIILSFYLEFRFNKIGKKRNDIAILTRIARAEKIPNRTVGLKFENINIKNPTIIVQPVINMALPVE